MKEKILFIGLVDMNEIKGDSNHFRRLTSFMEAHFDVFIISFTKKKNEKYSTITFPKNKIFRLLYWNSYIFYLIFKNYRTNRIKKIYYREAGFVLSPFIASFLLGIKLCVEINGVATDDLPMSKKITRFFFKNVYKLNHKFVASRGYAQLIHSHFDVPYSKILKVSLGFDVLPKSAYEYEDKFDVKTIVFIGSIVEYQGLDLFLEGYNLYVNNVEKNINLLIIGDGGQKEFLIKKVTELNLNDNVLFLPSIPPNKLNSILKKCHLGISTFSQKRGSPHTISALKTYDYINAKLPILTSDMDEMAEFIEGEKIGGVIYDYIPSEYCDKISKCLHNGFSDNAVSTYEMNYNQWSDKFSWNTRFDSIKNLILNL
jgi:glycosyltransferase involved in cell wall biosynthesis